MRSSWSGGRSKNSTRLAKQRRRFTARNHVAQRAPRFAPDRIQVRAQHTVELVRRAQDVFAERFEERLQITTNMLDEQEIRHGIQRPRFVVRIAEVHRETPAFRVKERDAREIVLFATRSSNRDDE